MPLSYNARPTLQELVELLGAARNVDNLLPALVKLRGGGKTHGDELGGLADDLIGLGLGDALDGEQVLLGHVGHALHRVEASLHQLLAVVGADALTLRRGNVQERYAGAVSGCSGWMWA